MTLEGMQRKMSRLEERVSEINARLNELKAAKADYEKQIEELKTEQIQSYGRQYGSESKSCSHRIVSEMRKQGFTRQIRLLLLR